jgi:hypothetical protein
MLTTVWDGRLSHPGISQRLATMVPPIMRGAVVERTQSQDIPVVSRKTVLLEPVPSSRATSLALGLLAGYLCQFQDNAASCTMDEAIQCQGNSQKILKKIKIKIKNKIKCRNEVDSRFRDAALD